MRLTVRHALYRFRGLLHAGNAVECPCCGGHFNRFLVWDPHDPGDENRVCPGCNSQSRHRMIMLYLRNETDIFVAKARVLHIAPEHFLVKQLVKNKSLDYVTADLCSPYAEEKIDVTDIPFPENSFDIVICLHVLEHIVDDAKAMAEICRVLKAGGWALVQVPIRYSSDATIEDPSIMTKEKRKRAFGQEDHVRICGTDYFTRLENAGLQVSVVDYAGRFDEKEKRRHGLMNREDFYLCKK